MPQVEPALQVPQAADLVGRDVGNDRFQAAGGGQAGPLGLDQPGQIGPIQDVVLIDDFGDDADDLLARQAAQGLHGQFQFRLAQVRFHLVQAALLDLLISLAEDGEDFLLVGPADFKRQAQPAHLDRAVQWGPRG